ncbi:hypothetical protein BRC93_09915 [Halobacteriales archaeon QS_5_70_15]|nr:MAG: hypothetical protein BRC93_09915 [Halobacteriales archaeon QS_5_70_15]
MRGCSPDPTVSERPSKAVVPSDGPADAALETCEEFAEAVATRPGPASTRTRSSRTGPAWAGRAAPSSSR